MAYGGRPNVDLVYLEPASLTDTIQDMSGTA